jgi:hypothetical protein
LNVALLTLCRASVAHAQATAVPVDFIWNARAECPSRDAVLDEVARLLAVSHGTRAHATARAEVTRDEQGRWHAALSVDARGAHGERTLDAEGCPAIASATALIIAVAVEGGMPQEQTPLAAASAMSAPAAAALPRPPASQLLVGAAGVLDTGMLPSLAPGGEATLGWGYQWSTWRIRALASASFLAEKTVTNSDGEGGLFAPIAVSARVCAAAVRGAFDVGPCLGGEFDSMRATGVARGAPASFVSLAETGRWVSVLGSVLTSWSFSRHLAIFVRADGLVSSPPTFGVQPGEIYVHRPSPVGARGALGVEVRFF